MLALLDYGIEATDAQIRTRLNDLAAAAIPSANGNHWEDEPVAGSFITNTAATALVALALSRAQPEQPLLAQTVRWLVVARGEQRWSTPVERATAVLSLTTYAVGTGELAGNFHYEVAVDARTILSGLVKQGEPLKDAKATLSLVRRIEDILDIPVPLGDLVDEARAWELGVDELAAGDEEVADYVKQLEDARDATDLPEASGEPIAREFERYLRRRGADDR